MRALATAHLAGVLVQAALAGLFVTGDVDMLAWHRNNAVLMSVVLGLLLVVAVLLWRPGRGPGLPALVTTGLLVADSTQIALGQARILQLHMPLGMAIFGASSLLATWAWLRLTSGEPRSTAQETRPAPGEPQLAPEEPRIAAEEPWPGPRAARGRQAAGRGGEEW